MRCHRMLRLIRIQTVCYSDSILEQKIEENANFRNSAEDILADDKLPSMQRVKKSTVLGQLYYSSTLIVLFV